MILVLNCGSQSIKWKVFNADFKLVGERRIGVFNANKYKPALMAELENIAGKYKEIKLVGHRVVFGGVNFHKPTLLNVKIIEELEKVSNVAPLHNPYNILGIRACLRKFPKIKQIAVFDTEFYGTLSKKAFTYALPESIRAKYGFRRYGFHGTSHEYAAKEAAKMLGKTFTRLKIISCHLGGGASITAIKGGRAVDTSMGFSPAEGLVMMTRSGSIDPTIILNLAKDLSPEKAGELLNRESGLKGICGESDMISIIKKAKKKDKRAKLALDLYVYQIQKYIGSYFAILGGCDLLVFTGAIGFGSPEIPRVRHMVCKNFPLLKNTRVIAIKPDEELAIARKIKKFII